MKTSKTAQSVTLTMKMGRKTITSTCIQGIQAQHRAYISDSGKGASQLTKSEHNPIVKDSEGVELGHISYNSRFWEAK